MTWLIGEEEVADGALDDFIESIWNRCEDKLDLTAVDAAAVERSASRIREVLGVAIDAVGSEAGIAGEPRDRARLIELLYAEIRGFGPVSTFLSDPTVSEIMVNGPDRVFVERRGMIEETRRKFRSRDHLLLAIRTMAAILGRQVDEETPYVDARLPDGSRVNAIIPPLAPEGPLLTIRKFSQGASSMADLVRLGTLPEDVATFFHGCVKGRINIVVSGGTNSGKTTMLNALAEAVDDRERIVTIEDACELSISKRNVARLESRPPDLEGKHEVPIRALLRNSLRMRPDRIIVGEVRGAECFDMLQAMNTGHSGSMTTIHANAPREALMRIETTFLMAGFELPVAALRRQVASAIHLIIHLERMIDGQRRVTKVTEVIGMEGDVITSQDLFEFQHERLARDGVVIGKLVPTGLVPKFNTVLEQKGVKLPRSLFGAPASPTKAGAFGTRV